MGSNLSDSRQCRIVVTFTAKERGLVDVDHNATGAGEFTARGLQQ
jgi:hypothetical protein